MKTNRSIMVHDLSCSKNENTKKFEAAIQSTASRDFLVMESDFNVKIGSNNTKFPENTGKFAKGLVNSSGRFLLEICRRNNLIVTNTLSGHRLSHRTTWNAPFQQYRKQGGTQRRNPVKNPILSLLK